MNARVLIASIFSLAVVAALGIFAYNNYFLEKFENHFPQASRCEQSQWHTESSTPGSFSIAMPCKPNPSKITHELGFSVHELSAYVPGKKAYGAIYAAFDSAFREVGVKPDPGTMFKHLVDEISESVKGRIVERKAINLHAVPGRYYKIVDNRGNTSYTHMFIVRQDVYAVSVVVARGEELDDKDQQFLESLAIEGVEPVAGGTSRQQKYKLYDPHTMTFEEVQERIARERAENEARRKLEDAERRARQTEAVKDYSSKGKSIDWYDPQR